MAWFLNKGDMHPHHQKYLNLSSTREGEILVYCNLIDPFFTTMHCRDFKSAEDTSSSLNVHTIFVWKAGWGPRLWHISDQILDRIATTILSSCARDNVLGERNGGGYTNQPTAIKLLASPLFQVRINWGVSCAVIVTAWNRSHGIYQTHPPLTWHKERWENKWICWQSPFGIRWRVLNIYQLLTAFKMTSWGISDLYSFKKSWSKWTNRFADDRKKRMLHTIRTDHRCSNTNLGVWYFTKRKGPK